MANIRISDLPATTTPQLADVIPIDGATTRKTTAANFADAIRPYATDGEAIAGTSPNVVMSPLRTRTVVDAALSGVAGTYAAKAANLGDLPDPTAALVNLDAAPYIATTKYLGPGETVGMSPTERLRHEIDATGCGITGDGSPADRALFETIATFARTEGRRMLLRKGTYDLAGTIVADKPERFRMFGEGIDQTIINLTATGTQDQMIRIAGTGTSSASAPKFTAAYPAGTQTVTLTSAASLAVGDYVTIQDGHDTDFPAQGTPVLYPPDGSVTCWQGQHNRIKAISGNDVTFWGVLEWNYTEYARVRKFAVMSPGLELSDMRITQHPDGQGVIILNNCRDVDIQRVVFDGGETGARAAIRLTAVQNFTLRDLQFLDLGSHTAYGGYCIAFSGAATKGLVENVYGRDVRHLITSLVSNADTIEPSYIRIVNCIAEQCKFTAFDLHPGVRHTTFDGCIAIAGNHVGSAGDDANGFQLRGRYCDVINGTAVGMEIGASLVYGTRNRIIGGMYQSCNTAISVRDSTYSEVIGAKMRSPKDRGLYVQAVNTGLVVRDLDVTGNPSIAAYDFAGYEGNWEVDYNSLKARSATTKITGLPGRPGEWLLLYAGRPGTDTGGSTSEVTLASVTVPAGSMGPNGVLRITVMSSRNDNANVKTTRCYFGGGLVLNATQTTGGAPLEATLEVRNTGGAASQIWILRSGTNGNTMSRITSSKNTALDTLVEVKGLVTDAGDLVTLDYLRVEVMYLD